MNLCKDRYVKISSCFVDAQMSPVTLSSAALRFFDIDHGTDPSMGPEVLQFKCTGGTFTLYGYEAGDNADSDEFLMHVSDNAKALERPDDGTMTANNLPVHVYDCPDNENVTLWSARLGTAADNPSSANDIPVDATGKMMERSMVMVNFTNVDCVEPIFANLPDEFREDRDSYDAAVAQRLHRLELVKRRWFRSGELLVQRSDRNVLHRCFRHVDSASFNVVCTDVAGCCLCSGEWHGICGRPLARVV